MKQDVGVQVRFTVDDEAVTDVHRLAFGSSVTAVHPWVHQLEHHSLAWVGAFAGSTLVGFANVCWDGGSHAFVLDSAVRSDHQRHEIGRGPVLTAPTDAGLLDLTWIRDATAPT